jgi:RHS repeat-associated protein
MDSLSFAYDDQGRRVMKQVSTQPASGATTVVRTCFLHDGWNIIAEMKATLSGTSTTGFTRQRVYSWGADMSGSTTGAGGVGGLAFVGEYTATGALSRPLAPAYDHNGNVIGYFDCRTKLTSGTATVIASTTGRAMTYTFEYDAFGRELSADLTQAGSTTTFPASVAPPIRFSTKYSDIESGWVYYGYRYYSPEMGRWVNRDPIGERGGLNLYVMVGNDAVGEYDLLGMLCGTWEITKANVVGWGRSAMGSVHYDGPGYSLEYLGKGCCKRDKRRGASLVQSLRTDNIPAFMDATSDQGASNRRSGGVDPLPEYGGGFDTSNNPMLDSPGGYGGPFGAIIYYVEVCAICDNTCRGKGGRQVLGCTHFEWSTKGKAYCWTGRASVSPSSQWLAAVRLWEEP